MASDEQADRHILISSAPINRHTIICRTENGQTTSGLLPFQNHRAPKRTMPLLQLQDRVILDYKPTTFLPIYAQHI